MNPVVMTIIDPWKEYWPSQGSNQLPPVLKSAMLPTELWGLAKIYIDMRSLFLFQTSPGFYMSALKTLWEKEKLFIMFSAHLEYFLPFTSNMKFSSANSFSLEESKICPLGNG